MRNKPLRGLMKKSPMETNTKFADKVFAKSKVDEQLVKRGEHTEGKLRGTKNTSIKTGTNNQMIDMQV
jgi:hypothetical protein